MNEAKTIKFRDFSIHRCVMVLCGMVLITAVALKVHGMSSGDITPSLSLLSPRVQLFGIEVEALVGVWLVSGYAQRGAWGAGLLLFSTLAAVSVYLAIVGQASCGCFGKVEVSPWASLSLDVACVTGLLLARRHRDSVRSAPRHTACYVLQACGLVGVIGLLFAITGDTARRGMARIQGIAVVVDRDTNLGSVSKGDYRTFEVVVENFNDTSLKLIGGSASCPCVATADLPLIVPANGRVIAHVTVKFTGDTGRFHYTFFWHTDNPAQPRLSGSITGLVESGLE